MGVLAALNRLEVLQLAGDEEEQAELETEQQAIGRLHDPHSGVPEPMPSVCCSEQLSAWRQRQIDQDGVVSAVVLGGPCGCWKIWECFGGPCSQLQVRGSARRPLPPPFAAPKSPKLTDWRHGLHALRAQRLRTRLPRGHGVRTCLSGCTTVRSPSSCFLNSWPSTLAGGSC